MKEKQYMLIRASKHEIEEPEFFDTYVDAHKEMKGQYEIFSIGCIGELNDDDAWCFDDDSWYNWKIFCIE